MDGRGKRNQFDDGDELQVKLDHSPLLLEGEMEIWRWWVWWRWGIYGNGGLVEMVDW